MKLVPVLSKDNLEFFQKKQAELDFFIHQKHQLSLEETFFYRQLALLVEIGELANEWKTFKYWKKTSQIDWAKVQDELVDCLHFFASLANSGQVSFSTYSPPDLLDKKESVNQLLWKISQQTFKLVKKPSPKQLKNYYLWLQTYEKLCQQAHLTASQLLVLYQAKNRLNQQRQKNNY